VVVLRTDSTLLYDRLAARNYPAKKLDSNMDAEIMQVLLEEAREAYDEEIVVELRSDRVEDLDENAERVKAWVERWTEDNAAGEESEDEGE
jgi:adenylate kinase